MQRVKREKIANRLRMVEEAISSISFDLCGSSALRVEREREMEIVGMRIGESGGGYLYKEVVGECRETWIYEGAEKGDGSGLALVKN